MTTYTSTQINGFTSAQIRSIATADIAQIQFSSINSTQISYLSDNQVVALTSAQITALGTAQLVGFTSSQIKALSTNGVAGLSSTQFNALTTAQTAGFGTNFAGLSTTTLAKFTSAQIGALGTSAVAGFTRTQITALSTAQLVGFTSSQIKALSTNGVAGFSSTQFNALTTAQTAGFGTNFAGLSTTTLAKFTSAQIGALTTAMVNALSSTQIAALSTTQEAGFTSAQIGALGTSAVAGFTSTQITALSTAQLAGFTSSQIKALSTNGVAGLSSTQFNALTTAQTAGFTSTQIAALSTTQEAGFTGAQIGALGTSAVAGFTSTQITALSTAQLAGFTSSQIKALSTNGVKGFTSAQIAALNTTQVDGIQGAQSSKFTSAQIAGFTSTQIAALSLGVINSWSTFGLLKFLTSNQMAGITSEHVIEVNSNFWRGVDVQYAGMSTAAISAMTSKCIGYLTTDAVKGFTSTQITALSLAAAASLTSDQINVLTTAQAAGLTSAQIGALSTSAVKGFTSTQIAALAATQLAGFTADQTVELSASSVSGISEHQYNSILSYASTPLQYAIEKAMMYSAYALEDVNIKAFNYDYFASIGSAFFRYWLDFQVASIPSDCIGALSQDCVAALSSSSILALSEDQWAGFGTNFAGFTAIQIPYIPSYAIYDLSKSAFNAITIEQINAMREGQRYWVVKSIADLNDEVIQQLTAMHFSHFPHNAIIEMSAHQFGLLKMDVILGFEERIIKMYKDRNESILFDYLQIGGLTTRQVGLISGGFISCLSTNAITGFTSTQIALLSVASVAGFDRDQITALRNHAVPGFTSAQITALTTAQLAGFTSAQITALNNFAVAGFTSAQITALTTAQLAGFTSAQITALNNFAVAGFTSAQITALNNFAVAGFTSAQITALTTAQLAGFTSAQITALNNFAVAGFTSTQITALSSNAVAGFTSAQITALNNFAEAGFTGTQIAALSSNAVAGFTSAQITALNNFAEAGFTSTQIAALSSNAVAGFTSTQIAALTTIQEAGFTSTQIAALSSNAVAGFTSTQIAALTTIQEAGFTSTQIAALSSNAVAGFTSTQIAALTSIQEAGFTSTQITALSSNAVAGFTSTQYNALTSAQKTGFGANFAGLSTSIVSDLTSTQIAALSSNAVAGFTSTQIAALTTIQEAGFTSTQITALSSNAVAGFTSTQIAALTTIQEAGFTSTQIAALSSNAVAGLTSTQYNALTTTQAAGFGANFAGLRTTTLVALTSAQIGALTTAMVNALTETQSSYLSSAQIAALNHNQFKLLSSSAVKGLFTLNGISLIQINGLGQSIIGMNSFALKTLSTAKINALSNSALSYLSSQQLREIETFAIGALLPTKINSLSSAAVCALSEANIKNFTTSQWRSFGSNFAGFTSEQLGWISTSAIQCLNYEAIHSMTSAQVDKLSNDQIRALSAHQIGSLSTSAVQGFGYADLWVHQYWIPGDGRDTPPELVTESGGLWTNQYAGFTSAQIGALSASALEGFGLFEYSREWSYLTDDQIAGFGANIMDCTSYANPYKNYSTSPILSLGSHQISLLSSDAVHAFTATITAGQGEKIAGYTSYQISALTTQAITGLGASNNNYLALLSTNAVGGFTSTQITALSTAQLAGFTSSQIKALSTNGVAGLTSTQYNKLTPTQRAGLGANFAGLNTATLAALTSAQIGALGTSAVAGFTSTQITALSTAQLAGFTSSQIKALSTNGVAGLSSTQYNKLTPTQRAGLGANFAGLNTATLAALTSAQIGALGTSAVAGFTSTQITALSTAQLAGFTSSQIKALSTNGVKGFDSTQVAALSADQVAGFTSTQVAALRAIAVNGLSGAQFDRLNPTQTAGFGANFAGLNTTTLAALTSAQIGALTTAMVNALSSTQIAPLSTDQEAGLTSSQIKALSANGVAGFSSTQFNALNSDQRAGFGANFGGLNTTTLAALTSAQIGALTTAMVNALSSTQIAALSTTQEAGFTSAQIGALGTSAVAGFTSAQIATLSTDQEAGLTSAQIRALTSSAVASLSSTQFNALNSDQRAGLGANFAGLNTATLAALTSAQIGALGTSAVAGFTSTQITALSTAQLAGFTSSQIKALSTNGVAGLSSTQYNKLTPTQRAGLGANFAGLNTATLAALTSAQIDALGTSAVAGFTSTQITALSTAQLAGFTSSQIKALSTNGVAGLSSTQYNKLTPTQRAGLGANFAGLNTATLAALTSAQIGALGTSAVAGFTSTQITALSTAQLAGFTSSQIKALSTNGVKGFDSTQVAALSADQVAGFTSTQVAALRAIAVNGLSGAQFDRLNPTQTAGFGTNFAGLSTTTLARFTHDRVALLSIESVTSISSSQLSQIAGEALATLNPVQISTLSPTALNGLTDAQIDSLTTAQMYGLSAYQISRLNADFFSQLSTLQASSIKPQALASLSESQILGVDPRFWSGLTLEQAMNVNQEALDLVAPDVLDSYSGKYINPYFFISRVQYYMPDSSGFYTLTGNGDDLWGNLDDYLYTLAWRAALDDPFAGLTFYRDLNWDFKSQMSAKVEKLLTFSSCYENWQTLTADSIEHAVSWVGFQMLVDTGLLTSKTINNLSSGAVNGLSASTLSSLLNIANNRNGTCFSSSLVSDLEGQYLSAFTCWWGNQDYKTPYIIVNQLTDAQIASLEASFFSNIDLISRVSGSVIGAMTAEQLNHQSEDWFSQLTVTQVRSISSAGENSAFAGLGKNLNQFAAYQLDWLTGNQVSKITDSQWASLSAENQALIVGRASGSLSAGIINSLSKEQIQDISSYQIELMTTAQIGGLSSTTISYLTADQVWALSDSQLAAIGSKNGYLDNLAVAGLSQAQYYCLTGYDASSGASACPLSMKCMELMTTASEFSMILPEDIGTIPYTTLAAISTYQFRLLSEEQTKSLTLTQVQNLSLSQRESLRAIPSEAANWYNWEIDASPYIIKPVALLAPSEIEQMQRVIGSEISENDMERWTSEQVHYLSSNQIAAITTASLQGFEVESIRKFSDIQLSFLTKAQIDVIRNNSDFRTSVAGRGVDLYQFTKITSDNFTEMASVGSMALRYAWYTSALLRVSIPLYQMQKSTLRESRASEWQHPIGKFNLGNYRAYKDSLASARQIAQGWVLTSTIQTACVISNLTYQHKLDEDTLGGDSLAATADIIKIFFAAASTARVPVALLASFFYTYSDAYSAQIKNNYSDDNWNSMREAVFMDQYGDDFLKSIDSATYSAAYNHALERYRQTDDLNSLTDELKLIDEAKKAGRNAALKNYAKYYDEFYNSMNEEEKRKINALTSEALISEQVTKAGVKIGAAEIDRARRAAYLASAGALAGASNDTLGRNFLTSAFGFNVAFETSKPAVNFGTRDMVAIRYDDRVSICEITPWTESRHLLGEAFTKSIHLDWAYGSGERILKGGGIFFISNAMGVASGITSIIAAKKSDGFTIAMQAINTVAMSAITVSDLMDVVYGKGYCLRNYLRAEYRENAALKVSQAATRLMSPALTVFVGVTMIMDLRNLGIAYANNKTTGTQIALIGTLVMDVAILSAILATSAFGGPVTVLAACVVSLFLPNFAAIGSAVDFKNQRDSLLAQGRKVQAHVANILYEMSILTGTPIIGWGAADYARDYLAKVHSYMDTARWRQALLEDFSYIMSVDYAKGDSTDAKTGLKNSIIRSFYDVMYTTNCTGSTSTPQAEYELITAQVANSEDYYVTNAQYRGYSAAAYNASYYTSMRATSGYVKEAQTSEVGYNYYTDVQWLDLTSGYIIDYDDTTVQKTVQITAQSDFTGTIYIDASNSTGLLSFLIMTTANVFLKTGSGTNKIFDYIYEDRNETHLKIDKLVGMTMSTSLSFITTNQMSNNIYMDNYSSGILVYGLATGNNVLGTQSYQCYTFSGGHDTVNMTGGFADVSVAGRGSQVSLGGGNNTLRAYLGSYTDGSADIASYDGGDPALALYTYESGATFTTSRIGFYSDGQSISESDLADLTLTYSGENTIDFSGASDSLDIILNDLDVSSTVKTATDSTADEATFKHFSNLVGSAFGDSIVINDADNLDEIHLGLGSNQVTIQNSSGLTIYYAGPNDNHIYALNSFFGVCSTLGNGVVYLVDGSHLTGNLQGELDIINAEDNSYNYFDLLTGVGRHKINVDNTTSGKLQLNPLQRNNWTTLSELSSTGRVDSVAATGDQNALGMIEVSLSVTMRNMVVGVDEAAMHFYGCDSSTINQFDYINADGSQMWDEKTGSTSENSNYVALNLEYQSPFAYVTLASLISSTQMMLRNEYLSTTLVDGAKCINLGDVVDQLYAYTASAVSGNISQDDQIIASNGAGTFSVSGDNANIYLSGNSNTTVNIDDGEYSTVHGLYGTNLLKLNKSDISAEVYGAGNIEMCADGQILTTQTAGASIKAQWDSWANDALYDLTIYDEGGLANIILGTSFSGSIFGDDNEITVGSDARLDYTGHDSELTCTAGATLYLYGSGNTVKTKTGNSYTTSGDDGVCVTVNSSGDLLCAALSAFATPFGETRTSELFSASSVWLASHD